MRKLVTSLAIVMARHILEIAKRKCRRANDGRRENHTIYAKMLDMSTRNLDSKHIFRGSKFIRTIEEVDLAQFEIAKMAQKHKL